MDKGFERIQQCITKYYKSFALYFCVGGFCALIDWGVFYILYSRIKFTYLLAAFLAFVIATGVNYFLSSRLFITKGKGRVREAAYVYAASLLAMCVDLSVMMFCIEVLAVIPLLAKIIGTGSAFFINYGARQFFIFSKETRF